ncbi:calcium sensor EFh [Streptomyces daqingensis]|uniref:Calcium sensor EFh n=1 Tax=Streptomyces daqingensis TaxID=1472640 RepID=A0ABQ2MED8_9ACTN|nr:calcium sensor EFh [Streptomyces daqingensis]
MGRRPDAEGVRRLPLAVLVGLTVLLCTSPVLYAGPAAGRETERAHSYGPRARQQLVAYRDRTPPARGEALPGVVVLHGGFWYQDRSRGWRPWARRIADEGVVVFDVDYRRSVDAPWPAQRRDVLRALHWIRRHAGSLGVDPRRLVLLGSSAGGHLATNVAAYGAGRELLAGAVALSPVVDPYRAWRDGAARDGGTVRRGAAVLRSSAAVLAGCDPRRGSGAERADCRRVWRDMSAVHHATGGDDAPMLLVHSRRDFVPPVHSEDLRAAERRRGMGADDVRVVTVPGAEHGGALMRTPAVAERVLGWIAARTGARTERDAARPP